MVHFGGGAGWASKFTYLMIGGVRAARSSWNGEQIRKRLSLYGAWIKDDMSGQALEPARRLNQASRAHIIL